tara:strand:- start:2281 stop:2556 length:276 start_codon:yes stop_codon:yes gene_type:complete
LDFRKQLLENFAIVFDNSYTDEGTDEEVEIKESGNAFAEKWGWFGVMYRLANEKINNLESITKLSLFTCLTWLSYEIDLNETTKVNYGGKH